uniref:NBS-LRR class disease resistance protein n=2 Tax=Oryza sativa TaxID=4530 RepID=D5L9G2_ORYSJ|nr:NBS-LRR class disease resistance protein [Oryza sativa Japonica Group]ANO81528.1 disease resistance protein [Oryza sativa]
MEAAAMAVTAATGALAPVLVKLAALLDDGECNLLEGSRSDAEFIRSELKAVHSLLTPNILGRMGDDDAACKDGLIAEVRELSYDLDDAVDDFLELNFEQRRSASPFGELKARVEERVSNRFSDWKLPAASLPPSSVHRRAGLPPPDAGLVGMDKRKEELIELLEQGSSDASRWRKRKPHVPLRIMGGEMQKIVFKIPMVDDKSRTKAMSLVASTVGVHSVAIAGDLRDEVVVVGDGIDSINLVSALRKKVDPAMFLEVSQAKEDVKEITAMLAPVKSICEFHEVKTICILGLPGGGKTTIARVLYHALGTQFQCRVFASISPSSSPSPNLTETLADIFAQAQLGVTDTLSTPYGGSGTGRALQQHLIDNISAFLLNKKYLIVIDDIWHWEEWEVIRKSIPKNDLGGRIIMTTRLNSIAEKCHTDDNDVFVYEVGDLDNNDALSLSWGIATKSGAGNRIGTGEDNPCYDIVNMCYGMPLALIWLSSALVGEIEELGGAEVKKCRDLRHIEDGILDIPSLQPLAESLCLGYNHLPLYLRTLLLYCSAYHWSNRIERGRLVRRWIAEGFVSEEKEAEGYFGELINRGWITQHGDNNSYNYYEIHPVMLAFLRCKSKEYNFLTCLGLGSDTSTSASSPRLIRRLSLQGGYPVDCLSSMSMDVSHTCSLVVLGDVARPKGIPFYMFKRLRVLDLEDNKDIQDSHLQGICEQLSLRVRYLGLKGTRIRKLPQEMRKLKHLEILYVGSTRISELPQEIGELKHLRILDVRNTDITELPLQIRELQHLHTLDVRNTPISELPPQVGKLQNLKIMCVRSTGVRELPKEIGELNHLQTLDVRNTRVRELPWQAGQISQSLRVLAGDSGDGVRLPEGVCEALINGIPGATRAKCREVLSIAIIDRFGPPLVGIFKVPGSHMRIPKMIKDHFRVLSCLDIRLCHKLEDDDQKFLAEMPNLQTLVLRFEALPRQPITINGTGFQMLESFRVDSRVPRIAFHEDAMPNLKLLEFKFYAGPASNDAIGITNLKSLQKVVFRCSPWYKSDAPGISATIDVVKKEAEEHPNRPITLLINAGYKEISTESHGSSENIAGSSGIDTEPAQAQHDNLPAVRDDYKGKGILLDGRCPTCGRATKIEEETQDRVADIEIQTETTS